MGVQAFQDVSIPWNHMKVMGERDWRLILFETIMIQPVYDMEEQ